MKIRKFSLLSKPHRLTEEKDFRRVIHYGRAFFIAECGIKVLKRSTIKYKSVATAPQKPISDITRIGIVVPKKLTKTIVKRNRIKRQVRHIFIELLPVIALGYDIIFLAREKFLLLTFQEMEERIVFVLEKAHCTIQKSNCKMPARIALRKQAGGQNDKSKVKNFTFLPH